MLKHHKGRSCYMGKKYCEYSDAITAEELYEGLLGYGMFTNNIPPIFTSEPFLEFCQNSSPTYSDKEWHDYISFSSMRNINIPRTFGIPTPMKYQRLCSVLKDNWDALKIHFHTQTDNQDYAVSRIHLRKMGNKKELFEMNYKNWHDDGNPETDLLFLNTAVKCASKYIVRADISTCFPSIYTHSIPWALVGKDVAKSTCQDDSLWYNKIDAACSSLKNGETHGLLIGPHASNLLSEIVLTAIDKKLYDAGYRYFRNIDDYECFVESYEAAQRFLRDLEDALREYDLPLNHKKTSVSKLPIASAEKWIHKLNNFLSIANEKISYKEVNSFIDLALSLAEETGNSAVLNYAIKALAGCDMKENAKQLATQRLMHISVIYPYLIQLMEEYIFTPYGVDKELIKEYSDTIYADSMVTHNYEGICYAIYFSLVHDFTLNELDIDWVIQRKDCIMLLMSWIYYLKLNHGNNKATQLKLLKEEAKRLRDADMDRYWLFCYEALTVGNLKGDWRTMKTAGVSFVKDII